MLEIEIAEQELDMEKLYDLKNERLNYILEHSTIQTRCESIRTDEVLREIDIASSRVRKILLNR